MRSEAPPVDTLVPPNYRPARGAILLVGAAASMRDDFSDEPPADGTIGRLISGVFSDNLDGITPAEYALEPGVPALMDEGLERGSLSRRQVLLRLSLVAFASGVGGAVVGFAVGSPRGSENTGNAEPRRPLAAPLGAGPRDAFMLHGARAMARGPVSELIRFHEGFLATVAQFEEDDVLWQGVEKLMRVARNDHGPQGHDIATLLLDVLRFKQCPARFGPVLQDLGAKVEAYRRGK